MANRLAQQTSPYLQQHADNPVEWYPWGEEALARARAEDKPILLSIGYSACHWCHVMAHESFEDPEVAAVMNRLFVNIKVDREERPDLDQIYQIAHQMLGQRGGGWPLTVFMTPDQKPFYTGTYFPKESRYGLPGFGAVCERIAEAWRTQRGQIDHQNTLLLEALARHVQTPAPGALSQRDIDAAIEGLQQSFDAREGGFGGAPKFPHPAELEFCLRRYAVTGDTGALEMAELTLAKMALGGIYDQLGGGFARYSVDGTWTIPHFEKMLYDNGPLLRLYADLWCVTGNALYERIVAETAAWIMREMQAPEGGYYSSLDADSEHEEGKFYVWSRDQVRAQLSPEQYELFAAHYGLDAAPNFEGESWHLRVVKPIADIARATGRDAAQCQALLDAARAVLFAVREARVRPGRDEKILTSWNALAIRGMARAGSVFGREDWIDSAARAWRYIRDNLWKNGALLATAKDGRAHLEAYLDDYAFMLAATLELAQARFDHGQVDFAQQLGDVLLERFEDRVGGGFYFTASDHEALIVRLKPVHDGATPSGNGVAAAALQRLSLLTGEARYAESAQRALAAASAPVHDLPHAHPSLLMALEEQLDPACTAILRGPHPAADEWHDRLVRQYLPRALILAIPENVHGLPAPIDKPAAPIATGWVCRGMTCLPPETEFEALARLVCNAGQSV